MARSPLSIADCFRALRRCGCEIGRCFHFKPGASHSGASLKNVRTSNRFRCGRYEFGLVGSKLGEAPDPSSADPEIKDAARRRRERAQQAWGNMDLCKSLAVREVQTAWEPTMRSENLVSLDQPWRPRIYRATWKSGARANGGHRSARAMSGIPTAIGISQYMK